MRSSKRLPSTRVLVLALIPWAFLPWALTGCGSPPEEPVSRQRAVAAAASGPGTPEPEYHLSRDQTHNRFSSTLQPVLRVPSGAVVEVETEEASDGQLTPDSGPEALATLDFDPIHPLTGPIYVEGAEPGDVLRVTLHEIELGDWGWAAVVPGFGFLADEFPEPYLKTFRFEPGQRQVEVFPGVTLPLEPFPGVVAVAPPTEELLSTIPPRANGGNLDDQALTEGTVVYLPVFVEGALFSIGDAHALQGDGEVSGTAIEAPTTMVIQLDVVKDRAIPEVQYETEEHYAVTAFAETLDEAARKATRYMVDHLVEVHGMERTEAYVLCSLAGDLKIAEVVDVPHMLVTMTMPKRIFAEREVGEGSDEGGEGGTAP